MAMSVKYKHFKLKLNSYRLCNTQYDYCTFQQEVKRAVLQV